MKIKHEGRAAYRLKSNPDEKVFAEAWAKINEHIQLNRNQGQLDWMLHGDGASCQRDRLQRGTDPTQKLLLAACEDICEVLDNAIQNESERRAEADLEDRMNPDNDTADLRYRADMKDAGRSHLLR